MNGMDDAERRLQTFGESMRSAFAKNITQGIGMGIGMAGANFLLDLPRKAISGMEAATAQAISFEAGLLEVRKTADLTRSEMDALGQSVNQLSGKWGIQQEELLGIAAIVGQFGVRGAADITKMTEAVALLATSSNMTADEAAANLAQILNVFRMTADQAEQLGSVINKIADSSVATESEVADLMKRMGGAATAIGLTVDQTAALAGALRNAGVSVEVGGTAMTMFMQDMAVSSDKLVSAMGMTNQEWQSFMAQQGPIGALRALLHAIDKAPNKLEFIQSLGVDGARATATLGQLTQAIEKFDTLRAMASAEMLNPESLRAAAEARMEGTDKQIAAMNAKLSELGTHIGNTWLEALKEGAGYLGGIIDQLNQRGRDVEGQKRVGDVVRENNQQQLAGMRALMNPEEAKRFDEIMKFRKERGINPWALEREFGQGMGRAGDLRVGGGGGIEIVGVGRWSNQEIMTRQREQETGMSRHMLAMKDAMGPIVKEWVGAIKESAGQRLSQLEADKRALNNEAARAEFSDRASSWWNNTLIPGVKDIGRRINDMADESIKSSIANDVLGQWQAQQAQLKNTGAFRSVTLGPAEMFSRLQEAALSKSPELKTMEQMVKEAVQARKENKANLQAIADILKETGVTFN